MYKRMTHVQSKPKGKELYHRPQIPHAFDLNSYFLVCIVQISLYFNWVEVEGGGITQIAQGP